MEVTIEEYRKAIKIVEAYRKQLRKNILEAKIQLSKINQKNIPTSIPDPKTKISDVDISVRLYNILKGCTVYSKHRFFGDMDFKDITVGDLAKVSKKGFLKIPQVGSKALLELIEITKLAGIELKD